MLVPAAAVARDHDAGGVGEVSGLGDHDAVIIAGRGAADQDHPGEGGGGGGSDRVDIGADQPPAVGIAADEGETQTARGEGGVDGDHRDPRERQTTAQGFSRRVEERALDQ